MTALISARHRSRRPEIRAAYAADVLRAIGIDDAQPETAHVWLWRRLPHPDTLVPGGPEIDFGIQTPRTLVLGEAKWRSPIGSAQGKHGDKDQIQLRVRILSKVRAGCLSGRLRCGNCG